jgi:hypothetical protein
MCGDRLDAEDPAAQPKRRSEGTFGEMQRLGSIMTVVDEMLVLDATQGLRQVYHDLVRDGDDPACHA